MAERKRAKFNPKPKSPAKKWLIDYVLITAFTKLFFSDALTINTKQINRLPYI